MNTKKLHNPKSHSPAVYMPCWLIQISDKLISSDAKILYGRLSQWSTADGDVYRSAPQLSEELGFSIRKIERNLKELRDVGLIGTYRTQAGGLNHFEFYEHEWMHQPIKDELCYKQYPPSNLSVPPVKNVGTPPSKVADINKKEIKLNSSCKKKLSQPLQPHPVTPVELLEIFKSEFPDNPVPSRSKATGALSKGFLDKVKQTKDEYFAETGNPLTPEVFHSYLIIFKESAPGFCGLVNKHNGKPIGLMSFIGWQTFRNLIDGRYF